MSVTGQFELFVAEGEARWTAKAIVYGGDGEKHAEASGRSAANAFEACAEQLSVIVERHVDGHAVIFPRDRSKTALVTLKSLVGFVAMWAVRLSPYSSPDGLAEVLEKFEGMAKQFFVEGIPALPMRTFSERQLEAFLLEYFVRLDQVQKWNQRKNGNQAPIGSVTATSRPHADDDFIDLDALVRNIAHSTMAEATDQ